LRHRAGLDWPTSGILESKAAKTKRKFGASAPVQAVHHGAHAGFASHSLPPTQPVLSAEAVPKIQFGRDI